MAAPTTSSQSVFNNLAQNMQLSTSTAHINIPRNTAGGPTYTTSNELSDCDIDAGDAADPLIPIMIRVAWPQGIQSRNATISMKASISVMMLDHIVHRKIRIGTNAPNALSGSVWTPNLDQLR